jgi:monovalent cation:H+ antiporter-2, CPA2 family
MSHTPLIATIVAGIGLAFVLGTLANRFRLSPLVGYLAAGVLIGPFTPGFVADQALALQLAELGVILLMFGAGLHFSLDNLLSVKTIALPGALGQIALVTAFGLALTQGIGWPIGAGLVFGAAYVLGSTGANLVEVGRLLRRYDGCGAALDPVGASLRCPYRLARTLPARRPRDRAWCRLRSG